MGTPTFRPFLPPSGFHWGLDSTPDYIFSKDLVNRHLANLLSTAPLQNKYIKMGGGQKLGFAENFMLSGVAAAVSKTAAAPIERVKPLVQNQSEMLKQGILDKPYSGVVDCTMRTMKSEGIGSFWRGNCKECFWRSSSWSCLRWMRWSSQRIQVQMYGLSRLWPLRNLRGQEYSSWPQHD